MDEESDDENESAVGKRGIPHWCKQGNHWTNYACHVVCTKGNWGQRQSCKRACKNRCWKKLKCGTSCNTRCYWK